MTDHCRFATPEVDRTRALNDALRTSLAGGSIMLTQAVAALGAEAQREILEAVKRYDAFDVENYGGSRAVEQRWSGWRRQRQLSAAANQRAFLKNEHWWASFRLGACRGSWRLTKGNQYGKATRCI